MSKGLKEKQHRTVLLVETDPTHRRRLEEACRAAGVSVRAVSSISEVEHWPVGQIVITDIAHLSPYWRSLGALDVVVLVEDAHEGMAALGNGATRWLRRSSTPAAVAAAVVMLALKDSPSDLEA